MNIEMNPKPAVVDEIQSDPELVCTIEESESRLALCKPCENFFIDTDNHTKCRGSGCNISLMTTYKFKQCPLEKW
jgi:hypothetical protein